MEAKTNPDYRPAVPAVPAGGTPAWEGLGARETRERLLNVGECLLYLDSLSVLEPSGRDAAVVGVSESMVDAFFRVDGFVPSREGADEEMLVAGQGTYNLGGGANVIRGVSLYARRVRMVTRTGQLPPFIGEVDTLLESLPPNVEVARVADPNSQNAVKMRFVDGEGSVTNAVNFRPVELGAEQTALLIEETSSAIDELLEEDGDCAVVVSDYGRGQLTETASVALSALLRNSTVATVLLDPRPKPDELGKFNVHGATLTPNRQEAELMAGGLIEAGNLDSAHAAADSILANYPDIRGVVVTLDQDGALAVDRSGAVAHSPAVIKGVDVRNPSGAGDIVVAVNALLPQERFGNQAVLDTAVWLSGVSATETNTSTLSPALVGSVRDIIDKSLSRAA
jgi:bifunctional ADP-heptose synthase (sugar kinase/adenylyltransferase)